jgi:hypothetical protein
LLKYPIVIPTLREGRKMEQLEVVVADLENNHRQLLMGLVRNYKVDYLDFIRTIMEELKIEDTFDNYILIKPDGRYTEYTYRGHQAACPLESPHETGKELEAKMGKIVSEILQNPRTSTSIGKPFKYRTTIYPNNTILVVDQRFEEVALQAIVKDGIMPSVHRDCRQPTLFEKILNRLYN